jgi:hypothetical protein
MREAQFTTKFSFLCGISFFLQQITSLLLLVAVREQVPGDRVRTLICTTPSCTLF